MYQKILFIQFFTDSTSERASKAMVKVARVNTLSIAFLQWIEVFNYYLNTVRTNSLWCFQKCQFLRDHMIHIIANDGSLLD